ncbi:hypothetical protein F1559_001523 [Cyanidiococcus yangmingshanensis]|uniref:Uncharacterized protein n=1 Tax=Cyanidiococcus yangmingshanensis TaxID=2690220 RepID=A0A7J7ILW3_9RHOD|nr:hypothetical protein F1559_001523 [Cyanidiococcus yangmingshanensis]
MEKTTAAKNAGEFKLYESLCEFENETVSRGKADADHSVRALAISENWIEGFQAGRDVAFEFSFYRAMYQFLQHKQRLGEQIFEGSKAFVQDEKSGESYPPRLEKAWRSFEHSLIKFERTFEDLQQELRDTKRQIEADLCGLDSSRAKAAAKDLHILCARTRIAFLRLSRVARVSLVLPSVLVDASDSRMSSALGEW